MPRTKQIDHAKKAAELRREAKTMHVSLRKVALKLAALHEKLAARAEAEKASKAVRGAGRETRWRSLMSDRFAAVMAAEITPNQVFRDGRHVRFVVSEEDLALAALRRAALESSEQRALRRRIEAAFLRSAASKASRRLRVREERSEPARAVVLRECQLSSVGMCACRGCVGG